MKIYKKHIILGFMWGVILTCQVNLIDYQYQIYKSHDMGRNGEVNTAWMPKGDSYPLPCRRIFDKEVAALDFSDPRGGKCSRRTEPTPTPNACHINKDTTQVGEECKAHFPTGKLVSCTEIKTYFRLNISYSSFSCVTEDKLPETKEIDGEKYYKVGKDWIKNNFYYLTPAE